MAARLSEFIARYVDRPFTWGQDDCSLWLADWWAANHGTDPAAHLRGTYSTEAEKEAIVAAAGSIVRLVGGICERVGALPVLRNAELREGDFGVIAPGVGGIYAGDFWVARSHTGVLFTKEARLWRAWSI